MLKSFADLLRVVQKSKGAKEFYLQTYKKNFPGMSQTIITKHCFSADPIKDSTMILQIIGMHGMDHHDEMINAINEYGTDRFFFDLWRYLDGRRYRDIINKYITFIDITLQYHKRYN